MLLKIFLRVIFLSNLWNSRNTWPISVLVHASLKYKRNKRDT